ncbi:S8 family peptidase [Tumebacillus sp. DT12]|uniref:S8 family peptidase n=1 Tax=Tumebacillus lacus TaxID=2995335 RepID=A0ABT3WUZ1_9BACL|nr:S8 family peptidase [Tumebacillus lacus]MCX7568483.1 S8 family peptidase [Tumebacillus lacus]
MKKAISMMTAIAALALVVPAGASATPAAVPAVTKTADVTAATDRILVKFAPGKAAVDKEKVHAALGGKVKRELAQGKSGWTLVEVPAGQAEAYKAKYEKNPNIEKAELDLVYTKTALPNDPLIGQQWHHTNVKSSAAWGVVTGSTKTIAIIDTGIDLDHPDLAAKIVPGATFVDRTTTADDDEGHGTHCAGIAAGIGNNGVGISGMDQTAKLMPVKVLNKRGSGYTSDIIEGVYFAADNGADVLSMSLGGGGATSAFQDAINYAHGKNKIVVAAAGNSGVSTLSYPAAYNNVLSVAATDQNDVKTSWSNYGSSWVDVAAPGLSIYSTYNDGGYTTMSGTSMATPLVAGLLSLTWGANPGATNAGVINRVLTTADNTAGVGSYYKYGRVNAYNAVFGF